MFSVKRKHNFTYTITCVDATVLNLIKELSHLNSKSLAVCIRQHPHDDFVEFTITSEELEWSQRYFYEMLGSLEVSPDLMQVLPADSVYISCPSAIIAIAIKRTLQTRIETLVITEVEFSVKTVDEPYEKIAHRFGQIFLQAPEDLKEVGATLDVTGRDVLACDIKFAQKEVNVVAKQENHVIVPMQTKDHIVANLKCTRNIPMGNHAKFSSVANPSFYPELKLCKKLNAAETLKISSLFWVDSNLVVHSVNPRLPVRRERFQEILPHVKIAPISKIIVGVESLGHRSAQRNVELALQALKHEFEELIKTINAFENTSTASEP